MLTSIREIPTEQLIDIHQRARFCGDDINPMTEREPTPTEVIIFEATFAELEKRAKNHHNDFLSVSFLSPVAEEKARLAAKEAYDFFNEEYGL